MAASAVIASIKSNIAFFDSRVASVLFTTDCVNDARASCNSTLSGVLTFASIIAVAANGYFDAQYNGIDVHVPWLDTDLKGSNPAGADIDIDGAFVGNAPSTVALGRDRI